MWAIVGVISLICLAVVCLLFITQRKALQDNTLTAKKGITPGWIIFFSVLLTEIGVGVCLNGNGLIMNDAASRVANAFYVLYIQPAHLASIGFVWNPLPSLLELPLMPLVQLYRPLATSVLAGVIVTSLAAAGTAVLIYKNCVHFKVPARATYLMVALYAFNPFIFLYGANGMSEAVFIFFIVLTVTELVQWIGDEKWMHLIWIGMALALAFLTRYEAIPFAAAVFLTLIFYTLKKSRLSSQTDTVNQNDALSFNDKDDNSECAVENSNNGNRSFWSYFEGTAIVVFMPLAASVILWIVLNWVIMGNPLYFLTSQYSNMAQAAALGADMLALKGNVYAALIYILPRLLVFLPLLLIIFIFRYVEKRLLQWDTLLLFVLAISIAAFHYAVLTVGGSYGWLRFFVYPLPVAMAWLPYEFGGREAQRPAFGKIAAIACCVALAACSVLTGVALSDASIAKEEHTVYLEGNAAVAVQKEIAAYINHNCPDSILLMDSYQTWFVILNLDSPDNVITTCSYTFVDAVAHPQEHNVQYILTIASEGIGTADAINTRYPDLYENGISWCSLIKDFGGYRLYEIIY